MILIIQDLIMNLILRNYIISSIILIFPSKHCLVMLSK